MAKGTVQTPDRPGPKSWHFAKNRHFDDCVAPPDPTANAGPALSRCRHCKL